MKFGFHRMLFIMSICVLGIGSGRIFASGNGPEITGNQETYQTLQNIRDIESSVHSDFTANLKLQGETDPQQSTVLSAKEIRNLISEYRHKKYLWFGSAVISTIAGFYFRHSANTHYQEYQTATNKATRLHRIIVAEDTLYPIGFGLGIACLLPAVSFQIKEIHLTHRLAAIQQGNGQQLHLSLGINITW